ncbi:MAG: hypothetical protein HUU20_13655 [Pirellulales bacterium]|nr:hypothetical protein [Pirellulales bacterium]
MSRIHDFVLGFVFASIVAVLGDAARADEPFDYFRNSWNVVGLKDYENGTRITPDNRLLLAGDTQVRFRIGPNLKTLSRQQTKTAMEGWLPVILLSAQEGPVRYDFTFWATPLPTAKDWQKAFDWPTEGENFLNWIKIKATNTGNAPAEARVKTEQFSPATATAGETAWPLGPGQSAETVVRIPFEAVADASLFAKEDPQLWLDRAVAFWKKLIAQAAKIQVPCRKSNEALLAAHVCQLIANDHGVLQGGEGFYDEFYIRDGGYQIMELEEAGLWEASRKAIERYLASQRPDGRFETQKMQFDANGQAIWVLWQFAKITGDRDWLAATYPQMRRAVDWMMKARREAPADSPYAGVLPNAVADGEYLWDGKHHIVGYDLWNLRGLWCTADAAATLGKTEEAKMLRDEADTYRAAIDEAVRRTGLSYFPPSWEKVGTHWGNTETLWPTELFPSDDPRMAATIEHARKIHGGGFLEGTIRWLGAPDAIHPYMSAYTTMSTLACGDHEQVVEDYYWYLLHSTAAHAFPEGIFYKQRTAWSDTIPHVTGASNFAVMLRHMLIHERGDELHLLSAVPDWWLEEGQEIVVEQAPTHFGPMNLRVRGTASGVELRIDPPKRQPPKRIVLHLPEARPLVGTIARVETASRSNQKKRWDFQTVVEAYRNVAPPVCQEIAGLSALPVIPPLTQDRCRLLDLAGLANTDPFTAPFGVPKPGKFLFTGLKPGEQTIGGVPFRVLDPAKNEGRGLVVLHSDKAPPNRPWPTEVEIPVGRQGKRVYFLGNVCGWSGGDEGTGQFSAVAEYVIHYADGQKQLVPLVPGRTIDEWAAPPRAADTLLGLRGDPWHLSVLGVDLRPVPVEKIVFRDLGTVSAPVLAAVTLEQ